MLIIKNALILDPASSEAPNKNDLWIDGAKIIDPLKQVPKDAEIIDAEGKYLAPAFFDLRCWQGNKSIVSGQLELAAKKALAGGFTTICLMPDASPVIDNASSLDHFKLKASQIEDCKLEVFACVTKTMQAGELTEILTLSEAGAIGFSDGFKAFDNMEVLRMALEYSALHNKVLVSHAADVNLFNEGVMHQAGLAVSLGLRSISCESESSAIARQIEVLRAVPKAHLHFMHLSTSRSVELIRRAKNDGLNVTCDVTPFHLALDVSAADNYNTYAKINPPLRSVEDQQALIQGLVDGTIEAIASDHFPCDLSGKKALFTDAPFGSESYETAFSLCFKTLVLSGRLKEIKLIELLTSGPAKCLNLEKSFSLKAGSIADLVLIEPKAEWRSNLPIFPEGQNKLSGQVLKTIKNGQVVFSETAKK